jgi:hypothetical protein
VKELDVAAVMAMNLREVFGGASFSLFGTGLEEAVERVACEKSFDWLRVRLLAFSAIISRVEL